MGIKTEREKSAADRRRTDDKLLMVAEAASAYIVRERDSRPLSFAYTFVLHNPLMADPHTVTARQSD